MPVFLAPLLLGATAGAYVYNKFDDAYIDPASDAISGVRGAVDDFNQNKVFAYAGLALVSYLILKKQKLI